jgi:8-amino-7-oxononanoate synthase
MLDNKKKMGDFFTRFDKLSERVEGMYALGRRPFGMTFDQMLSPTRARVGNTEVILAGTNNYLGLTFSDECREAAKAAIDAHGTATTGSRLANGTYAEHVALEDDLRRFFGVAAAIVFTTGYQANLAAISALVGRGDHLFIDADSHACIYDASRLCDAETIRFRHNSPEDLARRLSRLPEVIEGLYSMLGDVAPVAEFVEVAHAHGAMILVDEAHSIGCYGDHGRGLCQAEGVADQVDFITGTFSKSFASIGGFCVSRHAGLEMTRLVSRPYLFTASGSPANVATARAALAVMAADDSRRTALWDRARQLHAGLTAAGYVPASPPGPIIAVERPDELTAVREWNALLNAGIYVNIAVPPATPQAKSLLRLSVSAAHGVDEINRIIAAFQGLSRAAA